MLRPEGENRWGRAFQTEGGAKTKGSKYGLFKEEKDGWSVGLVHVSVGDGRGRGQGWGQGLHQCRVVRHSKEFGYFPKSHGKAL